MPPAALYVDALVLSGGDGSQTNPLNTIQAALNAAEKYDIIQVKDGTYTGPGNKELDFLGKPVLLISETGPESCIIDCEDNGRGFFFSNGEDARSMLWGLTVRHGGALEGGGIYCLASSPTIQHCVIRENYAFFAGGLYHKNGAHPIIRNSIISHNETFFYGGGILNEESNPTIQNCIVAENHVVAFEGGGIHNFQASPIIKNCTIVNNTSALPGGGIFNLDPASPVIRNCILWGNLPDALFGGFPAVTYSDVEGGWTGEGNIDIDPELTPSYRLVSFSSTIDAGTRSGACARDIHGETRWDDPAHTDLISIMDMGADEFVDTDGDGMADHWEMEHFGDLSRDGTGDFDGDGETDLDEYENGTDPIHA